MPCEQRVPRVGTSISNHPRCTVRTGERTSRIYAEDRPKRHHIDLYSGARQGTASRCSSPDHQRPRGRCPHPSCSRVSQGGVTVLRRSLLQAAFSGRLTGRSMDQVAEPVTRDGCAQRLVRIRRRRDRRAEVLRQLLLMRSAKARSSGVWPCGGSWTVRSGSRPSAWVPSLSTRNQ